ncbi:MAG: thioredoxin family protein [Caulobacteraceae bacterium]|nr:thioredoxin family protein [Caulobacter sp.]
MALGAAALISLSAAAATAAVPAPKAGIASFAELKTPLPYPYDEKGDADVKAVDARVARAKAQAKREHKLLLVDMGGNWCPDCRILAGTMDLPAIKRFVDAHYVEVFVDIGHMDRNQQVHARYGVPTLKGLGVPALLVVDPRTDKLLDAGHVSALEDARHMSPQALADWLAQWPST